MLILNFSLKIYVKYKSNNRITEKRARYESEKETGRGWQSIYINFNYGDESFAFMRLLCIIHINHRIQYVDVVFCTTLIIAGGRFVVPGNQYEVRSYMNDIPYNIELNRFQ